MVHQNGAWSSAIVGGRRPAVTVVGIEACGEWRHETSIPAQGARRDLAIERRGLQFLVPQQHLDDADVDLLFQEMGRQAVPQRMQRYPLVDAGGFGRRVADAPELAGG